MILLRRRGNFFELHLKKTSSAAPDHPGRICLGWREIDVRGCVRSVHKKFLRQQIEFFRFFDMSIKKSNEPAADIAEALLLTKSKIKVEDASR